MDFWHFPMSYKFSQSYISSDKVLNYLHELSNAFDLKKIIKFRHHVIRVRPQDGLRWEVSIKINTIEFISPKSPNDICFPHCVFADNCERPTQ